MTTNQIGMAFNAFIDDDTFATATATNIASAESIKAYVDNNPGGAGGSTTEIQYNNAGSLDGDPNFVTDGAGNLTAVSLGFSDTTKGVEGTATNDSAGAGFVGQVIEATLLVGSAVSLTSGVAANITSISLTAGDWDVTGAVWFAGTNTGYSGTTAGINTTSATLPTVPATTTSITIIGPAGSMSGTGSTYAPLKPCRISVSGTTTVYLIARQAFSGGTGTAYGNIWARRAR